MNEELMQELAQTAVAFTERHKRKIFTGEHTFFEYWLNTHTELLAIFQEVFVKHKDKHSFDEMIFFSLVMGQSVSSIMDDLHNFDESSEE